MATENKNRMSENKSNKQNFEQQFADLLEKAREMYPNIDDSISTLNNMAAQTNNLDDYLNLTFKTPAEISSNQTQLL